MKLQELIEGRVSDMAYNAEYDREHNINQPPLMNYFVAINGRKWKEFKTEPDAMKAATAYHNKHPRVRVDVLPLKE